MQYLPNLGQKTRAGVGGSVASDGDTPRSRSCARQLSDDPFCHMLLRGLTVALRALPTRLVELSGNGLDHTTLPVDSTANPVTVFTAFTASSRHHPLSSSGWASERELWTSSLRIQDTPLALAHWTATIRYILDVLERRRPRPNPPQLCVHQPCLTRMIHVDRVVG